MFTNNIKFQCRGPGHVDDKLINLSGKKRCNYFSGTFSSIVFTLTFVAFFFAFFVAFCIVMHRSFQNIVTFSGQTNDVPREKNVVFRTVRIFVQNLSPKIIFQTTSCISFND